MGYSMERVLGHNFSSEHMPSPLDLAQSHISSQQQHCSRHRRRGVIHGKEIMTLVRCCICAARHNMHIMITHIASVGNVIADASSGFQM